MIIIIKQLVYCILRIYSYFDTAHLKTITVTTSTKCRGGNKSTFLERLNSKDFFEGPIRPVHQIFTGCEEQLKMLIFLGKYFK